MYSLRFKRGGHRSQYIYKVLIYYNSKFLTNLGVFDYDKNLFFINLGKLRYYWIKGLNLSVLYKSRRFSKISLILVSLLVLNNEKHNFKVPMYFPPSIRTKFTKSIRKNKCLL